jgi:hypothetical protein
MRNLFASAGMVMLVAGISLVAFAADNDSFTLTYTVPAINEIAITGNATLTVVAPAAGSLPAAVTSTGEVTYAISTNCADDGKKITLTMNADMEVGNVLKITVVAPTGATGVTLSDISGAFTLGVDVVTLIDAVNESALAITLELTSSLANTTIVTSEVKTITLTIANS